MRVFMCVKSSSSAVNCQRIILSVPLPYDYGRASDRLIAEWIILKQQQQQFLLPFPLIPATTLSPKLIGEI